MRRKCYVLGLWSLVIALGIYVFTFYLYHYYGAEGFSLAYQVTPKKPLVTLLFGIWGVTFQFAGVMSFLVGKIFFPKEEKK